MLIVFLLEPFCCVLTMVFRLLLQELLDWRENTLLYRLPLLLEDLQQKELNWVVLGLSA